MQLFYFLSIIQNITINKKKKKMEEVQQEAKACKSFTPFTKLNQL